MTGNEVAIDTNQAIAVLNDRADAAAWIGTYNTVYIPVPVLGELRFGALKSARSKENLDKINDLVSRCTILDATAETAGAYAEIRLGLRQQGTPIPENDLWIAAICKQRGLALATSDGHFDSIGGLTIVKR